MAGAQAAAKGATLPSREAAVAAEAPAATPDASLPSREAAVLADAEAGAQIGLSDDADDAELMTFTSLNRLTKVWRP